MALYLIVIARTGVLEVQGAEKMGNLTWQEVAAYLTVLVVVGGVLTYTDLFGALFNLKGINVTHSGDSYCGVECEAYINITTSYWRVCFAHYNGTKYENYTTLFKKRSRSRTLHVDLSNIENIISTDPLVRVDWLVPTYGYNWRAIKDGDCWERGKVNRIKLVGYKRAVDTVKWGFKTGELVNIDPLWIGDKVTSGSAEVSLPITQTVCSVEYVDPMFPCELVQNSTHCGCDINYGVLSAEKAEVASKYVSGIPVWKEEDVPLVCINSSIDAKTQEVVCHELVRNATLSNTAYLSVKDDFKASFPKELGTWHIGNSTIIRILDLSTWNFNKTGHVSNNTYLQANDSVVALWIFEDGLEDLSKNLNDLTSSSAPVYTDSDQSRALVLRDDANTVTTTPTGSIRENTTQLTILVYANHDVSTDGGTQNLISYGDGDNPISGYDFDFDETPQIIKFEYGNGTDNNQESSDTAIVIQKTDRCYGMTADVGTGNINGGTFKWYNGSGLTNTEITFPDIGLASGLNPPTDPTEQLFIGSRDSGGEFNGTVDRIMISHSIYSEQEIISWCNAAHGGNFTSDGNAYSPVFNMTTGGITTGENNTLNVSIDCRGEDGTSCSTSIRTVNRTVINDDGIVYVGLFKSDRAADASGRLTGIIFDDASGNMNETGDGIVFDGAGGGVGDRIYSNTANDLNLLKGFGETDELSIFMDIHLNKYEDNRRYFARMESTFTFDYDGNDLRFYTYGTSQTCVSTGTTDLPAGARHRAVVLKDNETGRGLLYVDGVLVENDSCTGTVGDTGTLFKIGSDGSSNQMNGTLYEIIVWNRSLSDDEAKAWSRGDMNWTDYSTYSTNQTSQFAINNVTHGQLNIREQTDNSENTPTLYNPVNISWYRQDTGGGEPPADVPCEYDSGDWVIPTPKQCNFTNLSLNLHPGNVVIQEDATLSIMQDSNLTCNKLLYEGDGSGRLVRDLTSRVMVNES